MEVEEERMGGCGARVVAVAVAAAAFLGVGNDVVVVVAVVHHNVLGHDLIFP